jgi:hypothetical protein
MAINPGGELGFSMPAAEVEALTAPPGSRCRGASDSISAWMRQPNEPFSVAA